MSEPAVNGVEVEPTSWKTVWSGQCGANHAGLEQASLQHMRCLLYYCLSTKGEWKRLIENCTSIDPSKQQADPTCPERSLVVQPFVSIDKGFVKFQHPAQHLQRQPVSKAPAELKWQLHLADGNCTDSLSTSHAKEPNFRCKTVWEICDVYEHMQPMNIQFAVMFESLQPYKQCCQQPNQCWWDHPWCTPCKTCMQLRMSCQ